MLRAHARTHICFFETCFSSGHVQVQQSLKPTTLRFMTDRSRARGEASERFLVRGKNAGTAHRIAAIRRIRDWSRSGANSASPIELRSLAARCGIASLARRIRSAISFQSDERRRSVPLHFRDNRPFREKIE